MTQTARLPRAGAGSGHRHDRRAHRAGAEGHRHGRDGAAAGIEIPVFCYEPRLGAPVGACRMCLVEVEGMPKLQAGCTLTAQDGMVVKTARTLRAGGRGPERDARVHPRQPSARLPGLRQGRRVPAAGPDVPLRPRQHAHDVPEADVREADPDLAADRARPRALHPLLPLHALQRVGRRGRPARRDQPRRAVGDRDVRGRAVQGPLLRQRHRALPGRRAHLDAVPLRGAPVGDPERADRLRALPGRLQHQPRRRARARSSASSRATIPRSTRAGCATRAASRSTTCTRADRITTPLRKAGPRRFEELSWDDALDTAEQLLRDGGASTVTALSGSESVEEAYALAKLMRQGLGAHAAVLPEDVPDGLDGYRAPLSALRDATDNRRRLRRARRRARTGRRALAEGRAAQGRDDHLRRARRAGRRARHRPARSSPTARATSTTSRAHRTAAASPTPGAPPATASPPTASRASSSSRATKPRPTLQCARWPPTRRS